MSGIGISPCPPFAKPPGVPGVLYDGNTVAWFKHNDMTSIIMDGANRMSYWLDRMNYVIGVELVDQVNWPLLAYWNVVGANWSSGITNLHSDGNTGNITKNLFWTVGFTYRITVTIILAGGTFYPPYDGVTLTTGMIASGTYTYTYTPGATNMQMRSLLFDGTVQAISIKRVSGNHLIQATGVAQPLWSAANGVLFDGINDFMKCSPFAFVQPEFIYFVVRQVTWTALKFIYDGNSDIFGSMYQWTVSPSLRISNGIGCADDINLILNTFGITRGLFDNLNSSFQINNNPIQIGNFGINNMNGFTLGCSGNGVANFSNIEVKEIILRRTADNAAVQLQIYNYLRNANAIP